MSNDVDLTLLAKELHRGIRRSFPRRKVYSPAPDWIWSSDLIDYNNIKKHNDGYAYLLVCVDVFSKFVRAVPLIDKSARSMVKAFESFDKLPKFVWADKGKEFYNKSLEAFFNQNGVKLYSTYSESKSVIAERFNRTFKNWMQLHFTMSNSWRWINTWEEILNQCNNLVHSTTKVKPIDALKKKESFQTVYNNLYEKYDNTTENLPRNALKVGDFVRVSRDKSIFEKGYDYNWSEEFFKVREVLNTNPITYRLEDFNGDPIEGTFYRFELVKTKLNDLDSVFRIEKVLKEDKKNKRIFVKWKGWPKKFNSWVNKDQATDI